MNCYKILSAGILMMLSATAANALPIRGEVHFFGSFVPTGGTPAPGQGPTTALADATGITLSSVSALLGSEDLAPLETLNATMGPIVFGTPTAPLWTIATLAGAWQMSLDTLITVEQTRTSLILRGSGLLSGPGFDPTDASWLLTGNCGPAFCTFSNQTMAVPEPAQGLVLAGGICALVVLRRLRRTTAIDDQRVHAA